MTLQDKNLLAFYFCPRNKERMVWFKDDEIRLISVTQEPNKELITLSYIKHTDHVLIWSQVVDVFLNKQQ